MPVKHHIGASFISKYWKMYPDKKLVITDSNVLIFEFGRNNLPRPMFGGKRIAIVNLIARIPYELN